MSNRELYNSLANNNITLYKIRAIDDILRRGIYFNTGIIDNVWDNLLTTYGGQVRVGSLSFSDLIMEIREFIYKNVNYAYPYLLDSIGVCRVNSISLTLLYTIISNDMEHGSVPYNEEILLQLNNYICELRCFELYQEWTSLCDITVKSTSKLRSVPVKNYNTMFMYGKYTYLFSKYMLQLSLPEGYKGYFIKHKLLKESALYAYLNDIPFEDAEGFISKCSGGMLFSTLSKEFEDMHMKEFLSGSYAMFDGYLKESIADCTIQLESKSPISDCYNIYSMCISPIISYYTGLLIKNILDDFKNNSFYTDEERFIYYIDDGMVGVAVKEDVNIENVLPNTWSSFSEVQDFDYMGLLYNS